jgi:Spy/CpxP family protein refolding chaperone
MLKQCLLVVLAASLISIAAPFASAQDSQSAPPSSAPQTNDQQASPSQGNGRWRHGQPDPAERTKELTKRLNLTSDQQTKVLGIFQSEKSQMESLRQDSSVPQQDRRSKMMDLRESTNSQVRAALDANQQKKWDEMQAKREERMQNHRQGPPDGGQTPQPQQ